MSAQEPDARSRSSPKTATESLWVLELEIQIAREEARSVCEINGPTSKECAAAWDAVEEMQAAAADQRGMITQ